MGHLPLKQYIMIRTLITFSLLFVLLACGGNSFDAAESIPEDYVEANVKMADEYDMASPQRAEPGASPSEIPVKREAKIIYTAGARARVENLDTALVQVAKLVADAGGYIASQHRRNNNYEHTAEMQIRLPAEALGPTLEFLPTMTRQIDYQNLDSRDVTEEWLDLESRLQTKRDVRDRYIEILRNRAQKVEDILNAEEKIRVITEEIEAKEGRLRYLRDQVAMSTFTLELYETQEYRETGDTYRRSFGSQIVAALADGWRIVKELFLMVITIWPLLILGGLGVWWWRRRKKKTTSN
jgi:hypothetical protein